MTSTTIITPAVGVAAVKARAHVNGHTVQVEVKRGFTTIRVTSTHATINTTTNTGTLKRLQVLTLHKVMAMAVWSMMSLEETVVLVLPLKMSYNHAYGTFSILSHNASRH